MNETVKVEWSTTVHLIKDIFKRHTRPQAK